jgi:hypothetical protein
MKISVKEGAVAKTALERTTKKKHSGKRSALV